MLETRTLLFSIIYFPFSFCVRWDWLELRSSRREWKIENRGILLRKIGGESHRVDEHLTVVIFELEAYPEPKAVPVTDLEELMAVHGSTVKVAKHIGTSQAFVWQRLDEAKKDRAKPKGP